MRWLKVLQRGKKAGSPAISGAPPVPPASATPLFQSPTSVPPPVVPPSAREASDAAARIIWRDGAPPPIRHLRDIGLHIAELCPALDYPAPDALAYTNHADTNPEFAQSMRRGIYIARTARLDAVNLLLLPPGTLLFGTDHCVVACDGAFIAEQFPPFVAHTREAIDDVTPAHLPVRTVTGEMLLVGRFGFSTWGHWLGELLPKLVLAEAAFPGRFRYVLPARILDDPAEDGIWSSIWQTLRAYGIETGRIFWTRAGANYRFQSLHAITPVWSDSLLHPKASEAMRAGLSRITPGPLRKASIVREAGSARTLVNRAELDALVSRRGYRPVAAGSLPFVEQVALFKGAEKLFGILGSDFTSLIFSPRGVDLITAAPTKFGDRFFYALVLDRGGRMADLRGPEVADLDAGHRASFTLAPAALQAALDIMG